MKNAQALFEIQQVNLKVNKITWKYDFLINSGRNAHFKLNLKLKKQMQKNYTYLK
jgi:hypothetical protein